jgi:hypothetical protein
MYVEEEKLSWHVERNIKSFRFGLGGKEYKTKSFRFAVDCAKL